MANHPDPVCVELEVELEHESYPRGQDALCRGLVRFRIADPPDAAVRQPAPTHLCLVLDVSGSMDVPDKYPMLLDAVRLLCEGLTDAQRLTLIPFSSQARAVACGVSGATAARTAGELISRIAGVPFRFRGTYLAPALTAALDQLVALSAQEPERVQRLYVMTDGQLADLADCLRFTDYLRQLGVEFTAYGFGGDFALETMRAIIGPCLGGGVKHIPDGSTLLETFRHLASLGSRVVGTDAELELAFEPAVIPGDAFLYRPLPRWFPRRGGAATLRIPLGALEVQRPYAVAFEARAPRGLAGAATLGQAVLRYTASSTPQSLAAFVVARFTGTAQGELRQSVRDVLEDATALRDKDPQSLLRAYRARLAVYRREYRHRDEIAALERAIVSLERTGSLEELSEGERREVEADRNTVLTDFRTLYDAGMR